MVFMAPPIFESISEILCKMAASVNEGSLEIAASTSFSLSPSLLTRLLNSATDTDYSLASKVSLALRIIYFKVASFLDRSCIMIVRRSSMYSLMVSLMKCSSIIFDDMAFSCLAVMNVSYYSVTCIFEWSSCIFLTLSYVTIASVILKSNFGDLTMSLRGDCSFLLFSCLNGLSFYSIIIKRTIFNL